jgi:hypothetical protein
MSRRGSLVIPLALAADVLAGNREGILVDNTPIGTYVMDISDSSIIPVLIPYIPLAFLVRASITICLSSAFHLRFFGSLLMTDLI